MVVSEFKRAWVIQRIMELAEVEGCMLLTARHRYKVSEHRFLTMLLVSHANS